MRRGVPKPNCRGGCGVRCGVSDFDNWTGPLPDDTTDVDGDVLRIPVPPERWPHGPPSFHQEGCSLFDGGLFCDCPASDESDLDWGYSG